MIEMLVTKNALEYNCDMNLYILNQSHDYICKKTKMQLQKCEKSGGSTYDFGQRPNWAGN